MNSNDILDAIGTVNEECVKKAKEPQKRNSRKALWISMGTAAACLATILLLPHILAPFIGNNDREKFNITPTPAPDKNNSFIGAFAGDTRERNAAQITGKETAIVWPWEYRLICDQYPTVEYNGITYQCRGSYSGKDLSETWVGTKLGDGTAKGYDIPYEDNKMHVIDCELYEIDGVASERFLAVKYAEHDKYYVFMQNEYYPPATLGDLITSLNLPETFPFTVVSSSDNAFERFGVTAVESDILWEMFSRHASAETLSDEQGALSTGKNIATFTVDAEALGVSNLAWTLTAGGYLKTNIENYGYYYYLGIDAVQEILDYALLHKTEAPAEELYLLIGEVTEIGEDYIKVDDSVCMKDPEDGMEFTVALNDIRVKRHVLCGYLSVGDYVLIRHTDSLNDNPTAIETAYELSTGRINSDGDILIKE